MNAIHGVGVFLGIVCVLAFGRAAMGQVGQGEKEARPLAQWNFDKDQVGETPSNWRAGETHPGKKPGRWAVAADPEAPSKPNVLSLTTEASGGTFNVAIVDNSSYKDLDLRVQLRANTGKEDQGGGLIWRCKDENNYYLCRLNPLEGNFRVYKVVDGKRTQLETAKVEATAGKWYSLRAVMIGDQIACYVDGKKHLEAKDDTFKEAGKVGLWTKADASSSFDDLAVFAPPARIDADEGDSHGKGKSQKDGKHGDKDDDDDDR